MQTLKSSATNVVRVSIVIIGVLAAWTILASLSFLLGTGLLRSFPHPFYQWWLYFLYAHSNETVALWLKRSAAFSSLVVAGPVAYLLITGPMKYWLRAWKQPSKLKPPSRAESDNLGHADWLAMEAAKKVFPGPHPEYGGVVIGEAYRVDQDSVANIAFDPADRATWGTGGTAPLLIDPCRAGPTHSLVFAGAGSFKSTSAVSTLLTWTGSAVVLDPSGELYPILKDARGEMGHEVHQLALRTGSGFNVLDWIKLDSPLASTNILSVVDWICGDSSGSDGKNSDFFASRGRAMVACLLAHMLWDPAIPTKAKTLTLLRQGLSLPEPELRSVLETIYESSKSNLARDYAGTLKGLVAETFSGIYSNADEATSWLANPAFAAVVSSGDFKTSDLLNGRTSVFLEIPLSALQTTPAVARTIIGALINSAYEADGGVQGRILYLLDEVARLGPMKILETARDAGRKYGITLQLLYQSVGQLEKQWGKEGKREWFDGVSHRTYAAVQDLDTARELEETFGSYGVQAVSTGSNKGKSGKLFESSSLSSGSNTSFQEVSRALIRKEELMNDCRVDEAFVVVRGAKPMRCGRAIYFRRPEMNARVNTNRFNKNVSPQI